MADSFVQRKLVWLEAVACDRSMPRSAVALAVLMACRYFNGETGEAWPALRTLARDLGIRSGNVHVAVERMVEAGYLRKVPGGPRATNNYAIPNRWRPPERSCWHERSAHVDMATSAHVDMSAARMPAGSEPVKEPARGTREGTPRAPRREKRDVPSGQPNHSSRLKRNTRLPRDWRCGVAELAEAERIAGWQQERADREAEKFRDFHHDNDTRASSWLRYWRNWCRKGREIDERDRDRPRSRPDRRTGMLGGRWYAAQVAAHDAGYEEGEEDTA